MKVYLVDDGLAAPKLWAILWKMFQGDTCNRHSIGIISIHTCVHLWATYVFLIISLQGIKQFKCDQCDFACIQSFDLVKHKYTHGGDKPYKCEHCAKQFTRPARLREHLRQHTGEKPYQCEQCSKAFTQMTSLKSHMVSYVFFLIRSKMERCASENSRVTFKVNSSG